MPDIPKAVTAVSIGTAVGSKVDLTAVEYAGDRPMGSGPGGDHLTPLVVPNTVNPVGVVHAHKWWEIVVGLKEDEYTALFNTNVSGTTKAIVMNGENPGIGYFAIAQKSAAGTTRIITYETLKTYVAAVSMVKLTNDEPSPYVVEVRLICIGTRTVPAWGA